MSFLQKREVFCWLYLWSSNFTFEVWKMRGTNFQTIANAHFYTSFHPVTRMVHYPVPRGKLSCICSFTANVLGAFKELFFLKGFFFLLSHEVILILLPLCKIWWWYQKKISIGQQTHLRSTEDSPEENKPLSSLLSCFTTSVCYQRSWKQECINKSWNTSSTEQKHFTPAMKEKHKEEENTY